MKGFERRCIFSAISTRRVRRFTPLRFKEGKCVSDKIQCGAASDLHLHLSEDAVPCYFGAENWISRIHVIKGEKGYPFHSPLIYFGQLRKCIINMSSSVIKFKILRFVYSFIFLTPLLDSHIMLEILIFYY
ncbi:PREDICTED: uncharacterized protein LOC104771609 [Camelina sativa]|uniref:Uncharacterized protein LOC104771609 n=1 Tax=Camelina sativa TaxID=90675 RepID=A0ABM0Y2I1_CAMSA|nr:PREDICTED: uncharacterized protein LOC104771609 [Camelina sativa]